MGKVRFVAGGLVLGALLFLVLSGPSWAEEGKKININTASAQELMNLKGIGEVKAKAIIEYREQRGPFKTVDDLANVTGIGEKTLDALRGQITVGGVPAPAGGMDQH